MKLRRRIDCANPMTFATVAYVRRDRKAKLRPLAMLAALLAAMAIAPTAAGETVLHSFNPYLNGQGPYANVCLGPGGMPYGTTAFGGAGNSGIVWRINAAGTESIIHVFNGPDGANPWGTLLCDSAGNVYGTTAGGGSSGAGTVFRINGTGNERVLYNFTGGADGGNPFYGVVQDAAGNLYGTADSGGAYGWGVVFKLDKAGHETVLYSFTGGADGGSPNNIIRDAVGNIYGTTYLGGTAGAGVVFKLDPFGNQTVLYTFTGGADGGYPYASVVQGGGGMFYGTTLAGGTSGAGVVYKLDSSGNETVLYNFTGGADGGYPAAAVTPDSEGNLFGTASSGGSTGYGVVYKVDSLGNETVVFTFSGGRDGAYPNAGVVFDRMGNLVGDTSGGGDAGSGAVFKVSPSGQETVLYGFPASDAMNPQAGVVQDATGNLYGTANGGGAYNAGTVYTIDAAGHYSTVYNFTGGNDGGNPYGGVILGSDGDLYGVAGGAGLYGAGLVYKLSTGGQQTVLYSFTGGSDGAYPNGVARDSAGNLYGTTLDGGAGGVGTVFKVDPSGHETVLHSFTGSDGKWPYAGVTLDAAGNIYGTTFYGGTGPCFIGCGVVYKIDTGGSYSVLHNFSIADGADPWGNLILDAAGNLYGTTWSGGPASGDYPGVVFKIDTLGNFSVLYTFTGFSDGGGSRSNLLLDSAGNLFGTTQYGGIGGCPFFGCGVLFQLNSANQQTVLYSFSGGGDGAEPGTGLIRDAAGNLYGTTTYGGDAGAGVVYEVSPGALSPSTPQPQRRPTNLSGLAQKHALRWDLPKQAQGISGSGCFDHLHRDGNVACRHSH